jgi:uncharacterized membrane protein
MPTLQPIYRLFQNRLLAWVALAAAGLSLVLIPASIAHHPATRFLLAWNIGSLVYLALILRMMSTKHADDIKDWAASFARGRSKSYWFVVLTVLASAIAVLLAIGSQLIVVKDMTGMTKVWHLTLTSATVLTSWMFMNTLFALHYAHDFYLTRHVKHMDIMQFPGTPDPDYWDFLYCALVIGCSGQTSDVTFTDSRIRRVALLQCTFAFFFNTTILALTINIAAGLL